MSGDRIEQILENQERLCKMFKELEEKFQILPQREQAALSPWQTLTSAPAHRSFIGGIAWKKPDGTIGGMSVVPDVIWNKSANAWCRYDISIDEFVVVNSLTHWMETPLLPDSHS